MRRPKRKEFDINVRKKLGEPNKPEDFASDPDNV
jgi:hypothetical protein